MDMLAAADRMQIRKTYKKKKCTILRNVKSARTVALSIDTASLSKEEREKHDAALAEILRDIQCLSHSHAEEDYKEGHVWFMKHMAALFKKIDTQARRSRRFTDQMKSWRRKVLETLIVTTGSCTL